MSISAKGFIEFVKNSPTAFHAARQAASDLEKAGCVRLNEYEPWHLEPGKSYYVTRNMSSVIAFRLPKVAPKGFQIVASHSDSPMFKLKPHAEDKALGKYLRLNVERYGGAILSSWFDRPLSIAGRVMVTHNGQTRARLIDFERDAAIIPNMPIHFNREINDGYKYNVQVDLMPLYSDAEGDLAEDIAELAVADKGEITGADLFLYCRTPGTVWGPHEEYFSCPRIDDLECGWTSLVAFLNAKNAPSQHVSVYSLFDNEEVGSTTKQGAASTFLRDVMERVCASYGMDTDARYAALAASFMVSADNAHAVHPNHAEKYDANNRTFMNEGIVIKHNASQRYTSDAVSASIFSEICRAANAPVQYFANRSDMQGGGTLGNIANTQVSMNTVDIGLPQLAMHSSYETAGTRDVDYMIDALTRLYSVDIDISKDGFVAISE